MPERGRAPINGAKGNVVDIVQFLSLAEELGMMAEREGGNREGDERDDCAFDDARTASPSSRGHETAGDARYGALILYLDERLEELRQTMARQLLRQETFLRAEAMRQRKLIWAVIAIAMLLAALLAADIALNA